jgi:hypothetical protein
MVVLGVLGTQAAFQPSLTDADLAFGRTLAAGFGIGAAAIVLLRRWPAFLAVQGQATRSGDTGMLGPHR